MVHVGVTDINRLVRIESCSLKGEQERLRVRLDPLDVVVRHRHSELETREARLDELIDVPTPRTADYAHCRDAGNPLKCVGNTGMKLDGGKPIHSAEIQRVLAVTRLRETAVDIRVSSRSRRTSAGRVTLSCQTP